MISTIVLLSNSDLEQVIQIGIAMAILSAILLGSTVEILAGVVIAFVFSVTKKRRASVAKPAKTLSPEFSTVGPSGVPDHKPTKAGRSATWKSQGICSPSAFAAKSVNDRSHGTVDDEGRRWNQIKALIHDLRLDAHASQVVLELPQTEAYRLLKSCKDKLGSLRNPSAYVLVNAQRVENKKPMLEHESRRLLGNFYEHQLLEEMRQAWQAAE